MIRNLWSAASAAALVLALSGTGWADEPEFEMRCGTVAPRRTPWGHLLNKFKKGVESGSKGRIKVRVFFGGIKGQEQAIVRKVFKGKELQMGGISTAAVATLVDDIDIIELPYLFENYEDADRILDGPARPIIEEMLATKNMKLVMFSENGFRSFGTKFGFVKRPADLKDKKMRSQESEVHVEMYRALGASPVTISVGEVISTLQTGGVDGWDNTPLFSQAAGWSQGITHFTVTEHIYQPAVLVVTKDWYDALPADLQAVIMAQQGKLEAKGRKAVRALGPALLKNFTKQKNKVEVYTLTKAEKKAFKDATRPVWAKRKAAAGPLGRKLLEAVLKAKGQ